MKGFFLVILLMVFNACKPEDSQQSALAENPSTRKGHELKVIGAVEWVALANQDIALKARVDTGAHTNSLHAENIYVTSDGNDKVVYFGTRNYAGKLISLNYPVTRVAEVRNTSGQADRRYVIEMEIAIGSEQPLNLEFNLNDRSAMTYKMLLGRNAIKGHYLVDVQRSFILQSDSLLANELTDQEPIQ